MPVINTSQVAVIFQKSEEFLFWRKAGRKPPRAPLGYKTGSSWLRTVRERVLNILDREGDTDYAGYDESTNAIKPWGISNPTWFAAWLLAIGYRLFRERRDTIVLRSNDVQER